MEHTIKLEVNFSFSQDAKIKNRDKRIIMVNLRDAIIHYINSGMGIAPEDSDYCTEIIRIKHGKETLTHDFSLQT